MVNEMLETKVVRIKKPTEVNLIFGQAHFIKTVEDLYEAVVTSVPGIKFGLAFSEASGSCLVRTCGTDKALEKLAGENILNIGCGHVFLILLGNAFPINVLSKIKEVSEVVNIYAASANDVEVIVLKTKDGGAVLGVSDGKRPKGLEKEKDVKERKLFLRKIGYKFLKLIF